VTIDPALLEAAATLLTGLVSGRVPPEHATARLTPLNDAWPSAQLRLVYEIEAFDDSVSYDLLAHVPAGTLSVALVPDAQLPWPLRGMARSSEADLLRVGQTRLSVAEAVAALDLVWENPQLLTRLVDTALVKQELEAAPVELGDSDLQSVADSYRRAHGLLTAHDTRDWMAERGLTENRFVELMQRIGTMQRLRCRVVGTQVDAWLAEHSELICTVTVAWVEAQSRSSLELDPVAAVADAVRACRAAGVKSWRALEAPKALQRAQINETVSVVIDEVDAVARVIARTPSSVDSTARIAAENYLFEQWLSARRKAAEIEWFWGEKARTEGIVL
jgi:putative peptide maturation system protein